MLKRKRTSLHYELNLLIHAIDAAAMLAERRHEGKLDLVTGSALASVLVLARERLKLLDRVVQDVTDPALLWCPENAAGPPLQREGLDEESDRIFVAWSERKIARRNRLDWQRARRRLSANQEPSEEEPEDPGVA
jgi:hypothetical protein